MQFSTLLLAAAASLAAGQVTTSLSTPNTSLPTPTATGASGSTTCDAQIILDTCVSQLQPRISNCAGNDWSCLCQTYGDLLTCYDNCPGDPARFGVSQQQSQNCNAASAYGTTTRMVASSTSSGSSMATSRAASATSGSTESDSGSASGSAASATRTGAASALGVEVTGGVLAVVAAAFGLFM